MSKKFKSQASSARAASGFGGFGGFQTTASPLSYIAEQPDLSQISEPHVIVALKNLSKKDSTTKAKALDELIESLKDGADLTVLTAWAELYPRTSIDNSQIVRRNAHTLQGILTLNAGKKIAPVLPKIIPSWLAGTYDSDKSASKAASDALDKTFSTPDKKAALWRVYKDSIYERVEDALLTQTALTLSDERATSVDEAESKYVRVVGTGMRLLSQLITNDLENTEILGEKRLWDFVNHDDAYLRTATCNLLSTAVSKHSKDLDWPVLSTSFLSKGLNKNQTGSSRAFAQALCILTEKRPTVWTTDYTAKTASSKRLFQYLRQGSQNGPQETWSFIARLVRLIPSEAWHNGSADVKTLSDAYRSGVLVERLNIDAAWTSYIQISTWLLENIQDPEERDNTIADIISPLVLSYIAKSVDEKWRIGGRADKTAEMAMQAIADRSCVALDKTWTSAVDSTIEKMRLSLPETSKDFRASQDAVLAQGRRLFALQEKSGTGQIPKSVRIGLLQSALDLLKTRNGKPYGAAAIINEIVVTGDSVDGLLKDFWSWDWQNLLDSPSSQQIVSLALVAKKPVGLALLQSNSQSTNMVKALDSFARNVSQDALDEELQIILLDRIGSFESDSSRALAASLLANPRLLPDGVKQQILQRVITGLDNNDTQLNSLAMLETLSSQPAVRTEFSRSDLSPQLASKLLLLADSTNHLVSERAGVLSASLTSAGSRATSSFPIIRQQLRGEGDCLSILTLTDLGIQSLSDAHVTELLPEFDDWQAALKPVCNSEMQSSLSITSPLKGTVWMVDQANTKTLHITRDKEDFSILFRLVFFITKVFSDADSLKSASGPRLEALYRFYPVALEIVNEKLTLDESNGIWLGSTTEVLLAASDILSEGTQLLVSWLNDDSYVQDWLLRGSELEVLDRETYFTALAFQRNLSLLFDSRPQDVLQAYSDSLTNIHKSADILESAALLSALNTYLLETANGLKIVNELVSELTSKPADTSRLTLLNILLAGNPTIFEKIPQQRLFFLFKSLVSQLKHVQGAQIFSETLRLIAFTTPYVSSIYTDLWLDLIRIMTTGDTTFGVAMIYAVLQVYTSLKKCLKHDEVSEDLTSAWSTSKTELDDQLVACLRLLDEGTADVDSPRAITAEVLRRQLADVDIPETSDLWRILESRQSPVRQAAYEILHRSLPSKQEQLSIDLALEQKVSHLPEELLQLITNSDDAQRYLLSWKLVFDHFPTASYSLREVYTADLKSSGSEARLLEFLCEKLRITSGRPLDVSKISVTGYELDVAESVEQDTQWLSAHIYYLVLLHTPSLAKDWFLQQKNHVKTPLQTWTQKYLSPSIMSSSIRTVMEWSSSQSQDDRPIDIKASLRGSEIVASIAVDPESPPISLSISLPSAYPLESPAVVTRSRVGVSEKNWTSWLRTFQIIIFSSGSIIEGLVAFRRNVQLALKGQTECAICYSIIGTDMQTPNKKCGTCKNMFHGVCLFKWFKSSNSSSCPLCRNNFNYA